MSGGGKTVCRGRMGSSIASEVDPKELNNMENSLEKVCTCHSVNIVRNAHYKRLKNSRLILSLLFRSQQMLNKAGLTKRNWRM